MIPLLLTVIGAYLIGDSQRDNQTFAEGGEVKLLAPNGKPSNLTAEQYKLVRTPEFKAWFGDWENDAANASKVVDINGEPMVVYHNSNVDFNVFELKGLSDGFFFTKNIEDEEFSQKGWLKSVGLTYEQAIEKGYDLKYEKARPYFLKIKQFFTRSNVKNLSWSTPYFENINIEFAKRNKKNDGVEFLREIDNKQIIVAFEPNQIKLADGTNTAFDGSNPDIRFAKGGSLNIKLIRGEGKQSGYTSSTDLFGRGLYLTDDMDVAKHYGDNIKEYNVSGKIFDTTKNFDSNELRKFLRSLDNVLHTTIGRKYLQEIIEYNDGKLPKDTDVDYVGVSWALNSKSEFMDLLDGNKMIKNNFNSYADVCTAMNLPLIEMGYVGLKYLSNDVDDLSDNNIKDRNLYLIFDDNAIKHYN
jgi:hypothetical protein